MKKFIDFNCDLGEGFGAYKMGEAAQIMPFITSANIACGFHAGDPSIMDQTVKLAKAHQVSIGAHPGYPDLQGFGRRSMNLSQPELKSMLIYQIGALKSIAESNGCHLNHVKPHGALYNDALKNPDLACWIAQAVFSVDPQLILIGLAHSIMGLAAHELGLPFAGEVFADRRYLDDGTLCPRNRPGAVISDPGECLKQVKEMVIDGHITTQSGQKISVKPHTICLHGDTPAAIELAKQIKHNLHDLQITLSGLNRELLA